MVTSRRALIVATAARCLAAAIAFAACGGASPATVPATVGPPTSLPTAEPSVPPTGPLTAAPPLPTLLNPAPAEMLGRWSAEFAADDVAKLTISDTGIRITRFATATVRLEVIGDELVLSHSQLCTGEGRYRWSIEGDTLRFDSVEPDPCDGRAKSFDGVAYTRVRS